MFGSRWTLRTTDVPRPIGPNGVIAGEPSAASDLPNAAGSGEPGAVDWPTPDVHRLTPVSVDDIVLSALAVWTQRSDAQLTRAVAAFDAADRLKTALWGLRQRGLIEAHGSRWSLSPRGQRHLVAAAIREHRCDWAQTKAVVLPIIALGLPVSTDTLRRFRRGEALRAAALVVLYDLPLDPQTARPSEVRECLLARGLAARFPQLALPPITGATQLDRFSVAILRAMAGLYRPRSVNILGTLVARAVGAAGGTIDDARLALVKSALRAPAADAPAPAGFSLVDFAGRLMALVAAHHTPPFEDRLAIASAYEVYREAHPEHGDMSLERFKEHVGASHRARWLSLRRLDYINAIDPDLGRRSEVDIDGRTFHFVARDS